MPRRNGRKRSRDEFEDDLTGTLVNLKSARERSVDALSTRAAQGSTTDGDGSVDVSSTRATHGSITDRDTNSAINNGATDSKLTTEADEWQLVKPSKKKAKRERKNERKRMKKEMDQASEEPTLRLDPTGDGVPPIRVKDLQTVVLYVLTRDEVSPRWVAIKNAKSIKKVLVVMVPGMDKEMLREAVKEIDNVRCRSLDRPSLCLDDRKDLSGHGPPDSVEISGTEVSSETVTNGKSDDQKPTDTHKQLSDYIIPVKAPGDARNGRIHSPLQAMLICPPPEAKKNNGGKSSNDGRANDFFQAIPTPIRNFIHTAEQLVEADFPVHPAIFTDPADAEFETTRRKQAGHSAQTGWVDTSVTKPSPELPTSITGAERYLNAQSLDSGLTVYALDCEMVLTNDDKYSLARISIVDWHGTHVLDRFVLPSLPIKNYFTQYSGITAEKLKDVTTTLADIQQILLKLLTPSTVLIGHSLDSDLNAMKMTHPFIVDTSMIYPHPRGLPLRSSLKFLADKYLKRKIQNAGADGHDSIEDAKAVLDLVRLKCEKGPAWGTMEGNGESIFGRLARAGHKTAIVEYGTPEKGFGKLASVHVGCQNDQEVVDGLIQVMGGSNADADDEEKEEETPVTFAWGRLRAMEVARGWNSNTNRYTAISAATAAAAATTTSSTTATKEADPSTNNGTTAAQPDQQPQQPPSSPAPTPTLPETRTATISHIVHLVTSLPSPSSSPSSTLLVIYPGPGDMREVLRLQELKKTHNHEFRANVKWDDMSVKWTDREEQALRKAFEGARRGEGLVCLV